eukprot:CAMPEP_0177227476 /NCGR_PEP_ID=MMETSP0367-20130122/40639_1 /TAXON_ID=447022 ORGANISM="Scrippsiella hangoei-like, Strain SHHI-4" /NCGR_SAMPLE_ID=MMETSP0367 /ASSEMBLY_ACC=CAM_ASM_000362 /LENGTH=144 /DNA_ID=CAMNT_0018677717 /DNA_START=248 /DNA_END=682 /DNA_ORIENTATION=+
MHRLASSPVAFDQQLAASRDSGAGAQWLQLLAAAAAGLVGAGAVLALHVGPAWAWHHLGAGRAARVFAWSLAGASWLALRLAEVFGLLPLILLMFQDRIVDNIGANIKEFSLAPPTQPAGLVGTIVMAFVRVLMVIVLLPVVAV